MNIIVLGLQGSGKGTQAELLARELNVPFISMGALWREEIVKGTAIGNVAKEYVNQGKLVPDEITNDLIALRLSEGDCVVGFVLDGYPRNLMQLGALELVANITHVFLLEVSDIEALKRIGGRRVCPKCGANYHVEYKKPITEGKCDIDKTGLIIRHDDQTETIRMRIAIYHNEIEPIIEHFKGKGVLRRISGEQSIEAVHVDIMKAISNS